MQSYILFLGPPFVGKSTQMQKVSDEYSNVMQISTSEILRRKENQSQVTNILNEDGIHMTVKQVNAAGLYTDAKTVLKLVEAEIRMRSSLYLKTEPNPIISDSYPRSIEQLKDFEALGIPLSAVFYLHASNDEVYWKIFERRREARRYCRECNTYFDPITNPAKNGNCPKEGREIVRRADDEIGVARRRFDSYLKNAAPLVEELRPRSVFHDITINEGDRDLSPEEVFGEILSVLHNLPNMPLTQKEEDGRAFYYAVTP